jgi:hypothetical protein
MSSPNGAEAKAAKESKLDLHCAGEIVISLAPALLPGESCVRQGLEVASHRTVQLTRRMSAHDPFALHMSALDPNRTSPLDAPVVRPVLQSNPRREAG